MIPIADLEAGMGRFGEAETSLQRSLSILTRSFGPDHLHLVGVLHRLGALHSKRDDLAGAIRMLQRGLEIAEATLEEDDLRLLPLLEFWQSCWIAPVGRP